MWLGLALICALLTGAGDVLSKKLLAHSGERVVGWAKLLFAMPWLAAGLLWAGAPPLGGEFWLLLAAMIPLEVVAYLCYLSGIRTTPLSLAAPFLAFTPILTVLTSRLFLGEGIGRAGLAGVCAVTAGAYVLQVEQAAHGVLEPFWAMFRNPGIRRVLVTAALYGVTATMGKKLILLSSPTSFPFFYFGVETLVFTELIRRNPGGFPAVMPRLRCDLGLFALSGLLLAGVLFAHTAGITQAPVPYFISIKRLSLLVSVLWGGLLFREPALPQRLLGAGLMLAGAVVITCVGAR